MTSRLARDKRKICFKRWNYLTRLWRAIRLSSMPTASSPERMTEFISSAFDHTDARLKLAETAIQSVRGCAPNRERPIWLSLSILLCLSGLRPSQAGAGARSPHVAERIANSSFGRLH